VLWRGANDNSISNLRLRVDGLPALSEEEYKVQVKDRQPVHRHGDRDEHRQMPNGPDEVDIERCTISSHAPLSGHDNRAKVPPTQCLFCPLSSSSLTENTHHMASLHGLFIPSPHRLADLASLLGYLAITIFEYNECLYCGRSKGTVNAAQTHMRAKGHCMLNLNADSELLDFWDREEEEEDGVSGPAEQQHSTVVVKLSPTEMLLPSGAVISPRSDTVPRRVKPGLAHSGQRTLRQRGQGAAETRAISAEEMSGASASRQVLLRQSRSSDQRVAVRDEMGLTGLSESAKRALQRTEMKMKRREAVVNAARRSAAEQEPLKTKYYKVRGICLLFLFSADGMGQTEAPIYQAG